MCQHCDNYTEFRKRAKKVLEKEMDEEVRTFLKECLQKIEDDYLRWLDYNGFD